MSFIQHSCNDRLPRDEKPVGALAWATLDSSAQTVPSTGSLPHETVEQVVGAQVVRFLSLPGSDLPLEGFQGERPRDGNSHEYARRILEEPRDLSSAS